ncbi:hypothetical protein P255_00998 [Acinetobacter brisouii CIP 110357]|uniref:DUF3037 domain-containing protein n=1 Tax=Acinetobacter brisouii CIP 110357 TaxID=1341683 RepID=V2UBN8_9GAMM|nr:hypothetical protein [Acinetobacter brisouii]ENV48119.1 hypothetical protein F954_01186 [Acinetobacter brisouii ANC 4119]ESK51903.1 hypothetical protein P255_00998 [Acinetobacter brisouii CIP 110357]
MSLLERLSKENSNPTLSGEWMTIQWMPDLTTKECFNLGVVLKTDNEIFIRTIDGESFDRFVCMFNEDMKFHAQRITKLAEMLVYEGCPSVSKQLVFDNRGFIRGKSGSKLIDHLFDIAVPLGKARDIKKRNISGFHSFNLQQLSNNLIDELKRQDHAGINFEKIIPPSRVIQINRQNIHVPLRPRHNKTIGNWASVVFADPSRIKTDYLQAINDLRTASDELKREPSLFLLKPSEENLKHLKQSRIDQIDEVIDKLDSTLQPQGIKLYSSTDLTNLAKEVYEWDSLVA